MSQVFDASLIDNEIKKKFVSDLTYTPKESRFGNSTPVKHFRYYPDKKIIELPYAYARKLISEDTKEPYLLNTCKDIKLNYSFHGKISQERNREQEDVVINSIDFLSMYGTCIINVDPSYGKTRIGTAIASHFKVKTLIVVAIKPLLDNWKDSFQEFTNAKYYVVPDKKVDYNSLKSADVIVCTDRKAMKLSEDIKDDIGMIIIDEAHMFCSPSRITTLLSFSPVYIIALSATIDKRHVFLDHLCNNDTIINKVIIRNYIINKVETGFYGIEEYTSYPDKVLKWDVCISSLFNNDKRNDMICKIAKKELDNGRTILILTKTKDHVDLLYDKMKGYTDSVEWMYENKNKYNVSNILIGTISKIGTGMDQVNTCIDFDGKRFDCIIICSTLKKQTIFGQSIGRGFRDENTIFYYLVDSNSIFNTHWKENTKWLKLRKFEIKIVDGTKI